MVELLGGFDEAEAGCKLLAAIPMRDITVPED